MSRVSAYGLSIDPPDGWDVRIYRRAGDDPSTAREAVTSGGTSNPVLHLATVPLLTGRGDYGSSVVEGLDHLDAFVALVEFDQEAARTALFRSTPVPRSVAPADFASNTLQRLIAGQAGAQYFSNEAGRAFCLYVVAGSEAMVGTVAERVTAALQSLVVDAL